MGILGLLSEQHLLSEYEQGIEMKTVVFLTLVFFATADIRYDVLRATNTFRRSQRHLGLKNLDLDSRLSKGAQDWANRAGCEDNHSTRSFWKVYGINGENVAAFDSFGTRRACPRNHAQAVSNWKKSPGHRTNMLRRYTRMGYGAAEKTCRGLKRCFMVQTFAW